MWNQKQKAITFSYDDGVTQDIHLIELLNKYQLKATFNVNSELLGVNHILTRNGQKIAHYKIEPKSIKEIYESHEIAVHTLTHPLLPTLEEAEIIRQVEQDRINLEELVGYDVVGMAYPGGGVNNDDRVAKIIKDHTKIRYCRTTNLTDSFDLQENLYRFCPNAYHVMDLDRLFRMGEEFLALQPEKPQHFYIWGHSYEMDYDSSYWSKLEEFFALISGHDDIFYGTNAEVLLNR